MGGSDGKLIAREEGSRRKELNGNVDMEKQKRPDGEGGGEMKRHRVTEEEIKGRKRERGEY